MNHNGVYIIAELSANHVQDLNIALDTIEAAANSGANAIKVQTFTAESLTLPTEIPGFGPRDYGTWKGFSSWDLYSAAALPLEWHEILQKKAHSLGIDFFSTVFDLDGVDFLEELNVPYYKISSFEITDIPLIQKVAKSGKPIFISTGLASLEDIHLCVNAIREIGNNKIILLKCTSEYPTPPEKANLLGIPELKKIFNLEVGLSDHSLSPIIPSVAVGLGATVIERHLILNRDINSVDRIFSTTPEEFKQMVLNVRETEKALGHENFEISEFDFKRRKHIFAIKEIKAGESFSHENIKTLRADGKLEPKFLYQILNNQANLDIQIGTPIELSMLENNFQTNE